MALPNSNHPATRALHADDPLNLVTDQVPKRARRLISSEDPVVCVLRPQRSLCQQAAGLILLLGGF
ncbi:uncharacterized protein V1513DRAFT_453165 [Lipomyces chichibuensis]|uniref:uncharacterized protein n=1 Tax=Lipomyces chichibuensis TaxID=1546026 RepID=UPI0033435521